MSAVADIVTDLLTAGVDKAVVARVLDHMQRHVEETMDLVRPQTSADGQAERRREADRIRAKAKRDARKVAESADSPQTSADVIPSNDGAPRTSNLVPGSKLPTPYRSPAPKRASALPPDWQPDQQDRAFAAKHDLVEPALSTEAERFRSHHGSKGSTMKDWHAAWRTWVLSPFRKPSTGPPSGRHDVPSWTDLGFAAASRMKSREQPDHQDDFGTAGTHRQGPGYAGSPHRRSTGAAHESGSPVLDLVPVRSD